MGRRTKISAFYARILQPKNKDITMAEEQPVKAEVTEIQKKINTRSLELKELKRIGTIEKEIVTLKSKVEKLKQEKKTLLEKYKL